MAQHERLTISSDGQENGKALAQDSSAIIIEDGKPKSPQRNELVDFFFEDVKKREEERRPLAMREYLEGVLTEEIPHYPNAYAILYAAIEDAGYKDLPSGYRDYYFFSKRTKKNPEESRSKPKNQEEVPDEKTVIGQHRALNQLVDYVKTSRDAGGKDDFVVLLGEVGSGKTLVANTIVDGLIEFTSRSRPQLYALEGCPYRCDPMTLIKIVAQPDTWKKIEEKGIRVDSELCPHCKEKMNGGFPIEQQTVVPVRLNSGKGILKLKAENTEDFIEEKLAKCNRGILRIPELAQHEEYVLPRMNDFTQGRIIQDAEGGEMQVDAVIIGDTTRKEWNWFKEEGRKNDYASMIDRARPIYLRHELSVKDEIRLYQKLIREMKTRNVYYRVQDAPKEGGVHVFTETLRVLAEASVRSHLSSESDILSVPNKNIGTTRRAEEVRDKKVALYNGEIVEGFNQRRVRELQEEGEILEEGFKGMAPRFMREELKRQLDRASECLDPITAIIQMRNNLLLIQDRSVREEYRKYIDEAEKAYLARLPDVIKQAYRSNYADAIKIQLHIYLDNINFYLSNKEHSLPEDANSDQILAEARMRAIEEKAGVAEVAKKTFREEVAMKEASLLGDMRRKGKEQRTDAITLETLGIPRLTKGVDGVVFKASDNPEEELRPLASVTEQDMAHIHNAHVRSKYLNPEREKKLAGVVERMIENHGCCECCAWKQLSYAARKGLLQEKTKASNIITA